MKGALVIISLSILFTVTLTGCASDGIEDFRSYTTSTPTTIPNVTCRNSLKGLQCKEFSSASSSFASMQVLETKNTPTHPGVRVPSVESVPYVTCRNSLEGLQCKEFSSVSSSSSASTLLEIKDTAPTGPVSTTKSDKSALSIDEAKNKCADLGFAKGTEKFGECVLKLSK
jgi:hypothetical protein